MLSYKGRLVDALGQSAEEGRDQQRYSQGSGKDASILRFPNGETRLE